MTRPIGLTRDFAARLAMVTGAIVALERQCFTDPERAPLRLRMLRSHLTHQKCLRMLIEKRKALAAQPVVMFDDWRNAGGLVLILADEVAVEAIGEMEGGSAA